MTTIDASACWTTIAPEWDRLRADVEAMKTELTARLLAGVGPLAGRRVLELGAGTGALAERLADAAGPGGKVLASDVAGGMVALLEGHLGDRPSVEVARIDACDIPLPDASVDVVVFRMGLMLIPTPEVALGEIRRVLRPGGRLGVAVWGTAPANPWMTSVGMAAMMHGLVQGGPPMGPGGPFSLADPDRLATLVRDAGFSDVSVTAVESSRLYADPDRHVEVVSALAPPLSAALRTATPEQRAALTKTVGELTAQYRDGDGVRLPSSALLCLARA
ncbi:MAG TPA: methyltransferase domain-containing protein [Jatrophihabitans sp.]|nr:methyltransferase domain-containing protein [Jatrophihabitans sp.]